MRRTYALAFVPFVLASTTASIFAADAVAGRELALRWCSACHLVTADQERVTEAAPSFAAIAKKPGFNTGQLTKSLQWPHPAMPGRELSRVQAENIAAYIATFAK